MSTEFEDEEFGFYEAACAGCDIFAKVSDIGLCSNCTDKFERDLIRKRDWAYSALAFGAPPENREELRRHIIEEHGQQLELIE